MMQTISRKGDTGSSCCRQQKNQSILPLWRTPGHPPLPLPGDPLLMRRKTRLAERKTENGRPVWDGHLIRAVKCGAACLRAFSRGGRMK